MITRIIAAFAVFVLAGVLYIDIFMVATKQARDLHTMQAKLVTETAVHQDLLNQIGAMENPDAVAAGAKALNMVTASKAGFVTISPSPTHPDTNMTASNDDSVPTNDPSAVTDVSLKQ